MNAFDFIITVAMGSAFGRILTAKQVSIAESLVTFLLLVTLQYALSFIVVRSKTFHKMVTSQPSLLYYNGSFLEKNLQKERILQKELLSVVRKEQFSSLEEIEAIILETDGKFSVIRKTGEDRSSSYKNQLDLI
jgi:uncharacterized membrane protein YcaP (DUF421 family)